MNDCRSAGPPPAQRKQACCPREGHRLTEAAGEGYTLVRGHEAAGASWEILVGFSIHFDSTHNARPPQSPGPRVNLGRLHNKAQLDFDRDLLQGSNNSTRSFTAESCSLNGKL